MKPSFYSLNFIELSQICRQQDLGRDVASWLYNWHYKQNQPSAFKSPRFSKRAAEFIANNFEFERPKIQEVHQASDRTVKFLFQLSDGRSVETVLIPFQGKYTACLSSQVGCAMNCSFCYTGTQGFTRNLETHEIVGQLLEAKRWLSDNRPTDCRLLNLVFMGQGEPLHNFDAVKKSVEIFLTQNGLSFADHKITISTAGFLPGLKRWRTEMPAVNIALSLHAVDSHVRDKLIPINRKYNLKDVLQCIDEIPLADKRFVTFEYLMIAGLNDSPQDASALGELLKNRRAFVNLIPFNPFPNSQYQRPEDNKMHDFKECLEQYGMPVTVRTTKGDAILAACGQLKV